MEANQHPNTKPTRWYHYLAAFFAGIFLCNILPHFIHGITGKPFPTPFANPPGKGLSSPVLNVLWATINFGIGFSFLYFLKINRRQRSVWIAIAAGSIFMAFYLASYFGGLKLA